MTVVYGVLSTVDDLKDPEDKEPTLPYLRPIAGIIAALGIDCKTVNGEVVDFPIAWLTLFPPSFADDDNEYLRKPCVPGIIAPYSSTPEPGCWGFIDEWDV